MVRFVVALQLCARTISSFVSLHSSGCQCHRPPGSYVALSMPDTWMSALVQKPIRVNATSPCQAPDFLPSNTSYKMSVTVFLLFHNLLLLVFSQHVHVLFGMCRYNYVSLLLVVHPFHSRMFVLWLPHAVLPYYRKGISLIFILLLPRTLSPPLGSLVPST